ncbi:MAG: SIS domain-containing protein [Clostridia bacterium]|nr:SIS domain-containing protein [Clostridia bacterium]
MKNETKEIYETLFKRYPVLTDLKMEIRAAFEILKLSYSDGGKLLICGNGGSAADSEHIVGELMKCFRKKRPLDETTVNKLSQYGEEGKVLSECLEGTLPALTLTSHLALSTAFANDKEPSVTFAQQLLGLGNKKDVLLCLSTSGNSKNCVYAAILAKVKRLKVLSFTGEKKSKLGKLSDVCIRVPETETFKIQELHLPIYHALCAMLEEEFF